MTQTNAERQRQWRERQKQAGYRQTVVWLPQEAVDILASYPEKERGQVILNALRNVTSITPITTPGNIPITTPGNIPITTPGNIPITTPGNIPITTPGN